MNIFNKVARQGLVKNRTRTLVTIIGVILSTALITAVATFAVSLQGYMIAGAAAKYGGWHVSFPEVSAQFIAEQSVDLRVERLAALENVGYAQLAGGQNPDKPYLFIAGFSSEAYDTLPIQLLAGRMPQSSSEVLLPAHVAANGGVQYALGDTLTLEVGVRQQGDVLLNQHDPYCGQEESLQNTQERTYTIVGICQRPAFEERTAPGYTLITQQEGGEHYSAFVTLAKPGGLAAYLSETAEGRAYVLNDDVLRFMGLSDDKLFNTLLYTLGLILILLVMLGSVFLIYNAFNISLGERTHQFGLLMSIGATEKQLRRMVLFEGACIGAAGIPLGILLGVPSMGLVLKIVASNFSNVLYANVPLDLIISVPAIIAAAMVSLLTILISAYIPARRAAAMPVMDCIRQTNEVKVTAKAVKTGNLTPRLFGLEGELALKSFKRNKQRYRSIVLSLTLSLVLFVTASAFGLYLKEMAQQSSVVVEDYDICFYTREMTDDALLELYDQLKNVDGVTGSAYQAQSTYDCQLAVQELPQPFLDDFGTLVGYDGHQDTLRVQLDVQFVQEAVYQDLLTDLGLLESDYSEEDGRIIMAGILSDRYYTQEQPLNFTLRSPDGQQTKTIHADFVQDYPDLLPAEPGEWPGYALLAIAPYALKPQFDALGAEVMPSKLGLTFKASTPGQSTAQMQDIIDGMGLTASYHLYNLYAMLEQSRNILFVVNLFTAVFTIMITLIAIANVFNTISTNIRLRRRELAMLRSVGMGEGDFNRMMRFECALYGARTMLWGLPLAVLCSWLIYQGLIQGGAEVPYIFPWGSLTASVLGVFAIVFLTMLYAVGKIKNENIIDALRDEMT